jgi:hypothetical protein
MKIENDYDLEVANMRACELIDYGDRIGVLSLEDEQELADLVAEIVKYEDSIIDAL